MEYNIIEVESVPDNENVYKKIFILKIPIETTSKERRKIRSEINKQCIRYSKENNLMDTLLNTAFLIIRYL